MAAEGLVCLRLCARMHAARAEALQLVAADPTHGIAPLGS